MTVYTAGITDSEGYNGKDGKQASWVVQNDDLNSILLIPNTDEDKRLFSIDGRMINEDGDIRHLRPGVYIRGNKKFVIK